MDILNILGAVKAPSGLWANVINWLEGGVLNYALVMLLLGVIIKIVMIPFDFYNRFVTKKNSQMMVVLQPEINKINKAYANNPNLKNQKTAELYKKHNYNVYGTCAGMLLYMVLSMVIFFTLWSSLNKMSAYKIAQEFDTLQSTYNTTYTQYYDSYNTDKLTNTQLNELTPEAYATMKAESQVVTKYGEIKTDFLWIENIWRPDTSANVTLSYKKFLKETKQKADVISEEDYNKVMKPIKAEYNSWNGWYLLAVINGLLSLGSMYITEFISKHKAKKQNKQYISTTNKSMMIIMPIIMALFIIFYNAAFGLYIVAGSACQLIISPIVSMIVDKIMDKKEKNKPSNKPIYSR